MLGVCPRAVSVTGRGHLREARLWILPEWDVLARQGRDRGRAPALGLRAEGSGVTAAYLWREKLFDAGK